MYLCFYFYHDLVHVIAVLVFTLSPHIPPVCGDSPRVSTARWDYIEDTLILECHIEEIQLSF